MSVRDNIYRAFVDEFGSVPLLVSSPGRVNLIGDHTDYNEGFVLPAAIDRSIWFAAAGGTGRRFRFTAADLDERWECDITGVHPVQKGWPNYLLGVVDQLVRMGLSPGGVDCVFGGDIPIGAGMSSSAALACGFAVALDRIFRLGLDRMQIVRLAQRAEHEFVGVRCGIMDQFTNIYGRRDHAIELDCRSLAYEHVAAGGDIRIVLCDTGVRRELAASAYNERRRQCEEGVAVLQRHDSGILNLRDVTPDLLSEHRSELDTVVYRRCLFVVRENERVHAFRRALEHGDPSAAGELMYESHQGLRDEYEVSCDELDTLVEIAGAMAGVHGARMMGAGFGGCTVNLVAAEAVDDFKRRVMREYRNRIGVQPAIYTCRITEGTRIVES